MRDTDLAAALRHAADLIDDHTLLDALLATINPYARGSASTNEELATAMKAQVRIVNDWRRRHNLTGGVVVEGAAAEDVDDHDYSLEVMAFKSAEARMCEIAQLVDTLLNELTQHVLAVEKGKRYRARHAQERKISDDILEIWGGLASVRLLMRESGE